MPLSTHINVYHGARFCNLYANVKRLKESLQHKAQMIIHDLKQMLQGIHVSKAQLHDLLMCSHQNSIRFASSPQPPPLPRPPLILAGSLLWPHTTAPPIPSSAAIGADLSVGLLPQAIHSPALFHPATASSAVPHLPTYTLSTASALSVPSNAVAMDPPLIYAPRF